MIVIYFMISMLTIWSCYLRNSVTLFPINDAQIQGMKGGSDFCSHISDSESAFFSLFSIFFFLHILALSNIQNTLLSYLHDLVSHSSTLPPLLLQANMHRRLEPSSSHSRVLRRLQHTRSTSRFLSSSLNHHITSNKLRRATAWSDP